MSDEVMSARSAPDLGHVLITGAQTLLGAELLRRLLGRSSVRSIRLLLNAEALGSQRALATLEQYLGPLPGSVSVLKAELHQPRFGLSRERWQSLAESADTVFHCAQREQRDQQLDLARQANVWPVESWLLFLGLNPEVRLHHLSTAFVAGDHGGLFTEDDLDLGQQPNDAFERSKLEAEQLLAESPLRSRIVVYRPGHLLGRQEEGAACEMGGAYPLLGSMATGSVLPGDGQARLDLVSLDYVALAMVLLAEGEDGRDPAGRTYHLVNGWHRSPTVRQAIDLAAQGRGRSRGARLLPRWLALPLRLAGSAAPGGSRGRWQAYANCRDLLHQGPVFDDFRAQLALEPRGLEARPAEQWLPDVVRRAQELGWRAPSAHAIGRDDAADTDAPDIDVPDTDAAGTDPSGRPLVAGATPDLRFSEKRFLRIGDVDLAYRDLGQGEPVVFFHGFAGAHSWDGVAERMVDRHRVIIVDTLGLADSKASAAADYGLTAQAARVRGLLSALDISEAHIVGNDTGGVIAQFFAVRWPHMVRSLVLSDCDAHGVWPPNQVKWLARGMRLPGGTRALTWLMRVPVIARSAMGFGRMVHDRRLLTRQRLRQFLAPVASSRNRRMRLRRFFLSFATADLSGLNRQLERLTVPTMVVWGGDNAYWSPSWGKTLYDAIPGARRFEIVPFASISCHEERPEHFARLLDDFLDQVTADSASAEAAVPAGANAQPASMPVGPERQSPHGELLLGVQSPQGAPLQFQSWR